ncbi:MAG: DUF4129 domain-containing protein [Anaerolineae bacterium]|nr:DUF4129 domain-containing protein [Anaerolineae bacterium]
MRLNILTPSTPERQEKFLKIWAFCQRELLFLCWAVMDVALLTPFALAIMNWAQLWPPGVFFLWLLLIMLLAFNLARLMGALFVPTQYQQVVMAAGLALLIFFSLRTLVHEPQSLWDVSWVGLFFQYMNEAGNLLWLRDVTVFFLVVLMWARGIQLVDKEMTINRIGLRLRVGGLIIAPLVAWISIRNTYNGVTPFILLFLLAGLTAVALTRAEEIAQDETGHSASLTPRWLLLIVCVGLLIVFITGIIAMLVSGEAASSVVGLLSPLWVSLVATVVTAVAAIGYVLQPFILALQWAVARIPFEWQWLTNLLAALSQAARGIRQPEEPFPVPEEEVIIEGGMSTGAQIIIILLAVAVILVVALLLYRLYRPPTVSGRRATFGHTTAGTEEDAGLLQKMLGRLGLWRGWYTAVSIRRIYRQMMELAEAHGYPKLETETPYEYLATLSQAWPQNRPEARLITDAYIKVRYGELPETEAELEAIRQAWRQLQQATPASSES